MQGSEFIDMMKKVLGVTTNKELASFLGITAEHISRLYKQESLSEKYVDRRLIHAQQRNTEESTKTGFSNSHQSTRGVLPYRPDTQQKGSQLGTLRCEQ